MGPARMHGFVRPLEPLDCAISVHVIIDDARKPRHSAIREALDVPRLSEQGKENLAVAAPAT